MLFETRPVHWNHVSEGWPEPDKQVLVAFTDNRGKPYVYPATLKEGFNGPYWDFNKRLQSLGMFRITHWADFPQAPNQLGHEKCYCCAFREDYEHQQGICNCVKSPNNKQVVNYQDTCPECNVRDR